MKREEAKELFRNDKDAYGKPKAIMTKIDKIYDEFESSIKMISVKDRLPELKDKNYLVTVKNKNKEHGIYMYDIALFDIHRTWITEIVWEDVTHWMPLPKIKT